jgi:hypothetical protein
LPSISITWRIADDNACRICKEINGYTWTFTDEPMPNALVHPVHGVVWDVARGSAAHESGPGKNTHGTCRCRMESKIDLKDIVESVKKLRDAVVLEYGQT